MHFPKFVLFSSCIYLCHCLSSTLWNTIVPHLLQCQLLVNAQLKHSVLPEAMGVNWVPFHSQKTSAFTSVLTLYCIIIASLLVQSLRWGSVFMVPIYAQHLTEICDTQQVLSKYLLTKTIKVFLVLMFSLQRSRQSLLSCSFQS